MPEVNLRRNPIVKKSVKDVLIDEFIDPDSIKWPSLDKNIALQNALKKLKGYSRQEVYDFVEQGINEMQDRISTTFEDINNSGGDGSEDQELHDHFRTLNVPAGLAKDTLVLVMNWIEANVFQKQMTASNLIPNREL